MKIGRIEIVIHPKKIKLLKEFEQLVELMSDFGGRLIHLENRMHATEKAIGHITKVLEKLTSGNK